MDSLLAKYRPTSGISGGEMVEMEKVYACNYIHRLHKEKKHLESSSGEKQFKNKLNVFENWFASLIL